MDNYEPGDQEKKTNMKNTKKKTNKPKKTTVQEKLENLEKSNAVQESGDGLGQNVSQASQETQEVHQEVVQDDPQPSEQTKTNNEAESKADEGIPKNNLAKTIIPPQLAQLETLGYNIQQANDPPAIKKPISPVIKVYSENEYVVLVCADGSKHPVQYLDAIDRADQVKNMLLRENTDKTKDERDKEMWLVRELVIASQRCSEYAHTMGYGVRFSQSKVDKFLFHLDWCVKQIPKNKI